MYSYFNTYIKDSITKTIRINIKDLCGKIKTSNQIRQETLIPIGSIRKLHLRQLVDWRGKFKIFRE